MAVYLAVTLVIYFKYHDVDLATFAGVCGMVMAASYFLYRRKTRNLMNEKPQQTPAFKLTQAERLQRLKDEHTYYVDNLSRLRPFINSTTFNTLDAEDRHLLVEQCVHMTELVRILGERVKRFQAINQL